MRRAILVLVLLASLFASPAPASAAFGLKDLEVSFTEEGGEALTQAGAHPFEMKVDFAANTFEDPKFGLPAPDGAIEDLFVTQVPGLAGNPTAVPRCTSLDFLSGGQEPDCSPATYLGTAVIHYLDPTFTEKTPVYNLEPPPGKAAKLGLEVAGVRVAVEVEVKPTPPYNLIARSINIANVVFFYGAELTLWGVPADPAHDAERGGPAGIAPVPFLTLPRSCEGPLFSAFEAHSWEGESFVTEVLSGGPLGMSECGAIGFSPQAKAKPTTDQAESPTGLDFSLKVEDEGLANPTGTAEADIRKAEVTLPEGMTLNPSVAEGLAVCTPAQFAAQGLDSKPGQGCPPASKVGTVEATTPLLEGRLLQGSLHVAQQDDPSTTAPGAENPFDSLIALYMVIREPELGLFFKLAGKVEPDPTTGQIVTSFDDLPPYPLGEVRIRLREGGRSPLITPPRCGTYVTKATFTPSSNPSQPLETSSSFEIAKGVGRGRLPTLGHPALRAGLRSGHAQQLSRHPLALPDAPHPQGRRPGPDQALRHPAAGPGGEARRDDVNCPDVRDRHRAGKERTPGAGIALLP